jgi:hypothetical protein
MSAEREGQVTRSQRASGKESDDERSRRTERDVDVLASIVGAETDRRGPDELQGGQ